LLGWVIFLLLFFTWGVKRGMAITPWKTVWVQKNRRVFVATNHILQHAINLQGNYRIAKQFNDLAVINRQLYQPLKSLGHEKKKFG